MQRQQRVLEAIQRATFFREFLCGFKDATGVRVSFEMPGASLEPRSGELAGARLLPRMVDWHSIISSECQLKGVIVLNWTAQIYEAFVPVQVGEHIFGILRTGCIREKTRPVGVGGKETGMATIPVLEREHLAGTCKMLLIVAEYLARLSNQLTLQQATCEPAIITRAKQFIDMNHRENVLLEDVAEHAHVSTFYLCKLFKRVTALTFSEFLMRTRIETAKKLLMNGKCRINEVALEAGFQSLSHFNRVFKRVVGQAPREFRNPQVINGKVPLCREKEAK